MTRSIRAHAMIGTLLATAGALTLAAPAKAQAAEDGAAQPNSGEIIVTANKRAENILTIASSVSSVSDQLIARVRANNLSDVAAYVPGLVVNSSGADGNRIVIRGLSSGPNDLSPSVGVYVDDAPFGASTGLALGALFSPDLDPSDLQRIEVLRGPQGTLYGANTLGGLVKYVTKDPDLRRISAHASADYGVSDNYGMSNPHNYVLRAGVNIPLVDDKVALRLSGFYRRAQGGTTGTISGRDDLNDNSRKGARAALLLRPNDRLSIKIEGAYQKSDTPHVGVVLGNAATLQPLTNRSSGADYVDGYTHSRYYMAQSNIRYEFDGGVSISDTTSYSNYKVDMLSDYTTIYRPALNAALAPTLGLINSLSTTPVEITTSGPVAPRVKRLTNELRIASPSSGRIEWLAGFFYDHQNSDYVSGATQSFSSPTGPYASVLEPIVDSLRSLLGNYLDVDVANRYREYAGFANATFHLTPTIDLGGGVRYSRITQHATTRSSGYIISALNRPALRLSESSDNVWTGSFDARWHFAPKTMLYARVSRGYRPGGPNSTRGSYEPDTTWNYETGLKTSTLGGKLTADIAGFFIDWKNIQLNSLDPATTTLILDNAGTAHSKGVEAEATFTPDAHWVFNGNLTYTDATMHSIKPGTTTGAVAGDRLPFSSKWAAAARADYFLPLSGGITVNAGASLRYRSGFGTTFPGDPSTRFYRMPATTFVDLRTGLSFKDNYSLTFQVLNVGNVRKLQSAQESIGVSSFAAADAAGQPAFLSYSTGRTFTVSATLRY